MFYGDIDCRMVFFLIQTKKPGLLAGVEDAVWFRRVAKVRALGGY